MISISRKTRAILSKIKFTAGMDPMLENREEWRLFIPEPYSAVILIQADFEMAWAWRWSKRFNGNIKGALEMARRERMNVPKILDLCDRYRIPVTWATVGHLLLDSCHRQNGKVHQDILQLPEFENEFWKFSANDWFEHDPGTDALRDPEWYAPDLIRDVLRRETKHEIGCHTFSHIDCSDKICSAETIEAEIHACRKAAVRFGIDLRSFVHPAHTIGNLDVLTKNGFTSFRTDYRNVLGYPKEHGRGLWELQSTMELGYRKEWSMDYHVHRYRKIIDRAIKAHSVCVMWYHPSIPENYLIEVLPSLFAHVNQSRELIWPTTSGEYTAWLNR